MPQGVTYHASVGVIPDLTAGGTAPPGVPRDRATAPFLCAGTGAPTFVAPKGSLYLRIDGALGTRAYINTDGAATWTGVTTAA